MSTFHRLERGRGEGERGKGKMEEGKKEVY
jgi:hypothetical protein